MFVSRVLSSSPPSASHPLPVRTLLSTGILLMTAAPWSATNAADAAASTASTDVTATQKAAQPVEARFAAEAPATAENYVITETAQIEVEAQAATSASSALPTSAEDAAAAGEIETIYVSSRVALAAKQDVPASISVISGDDLRALGADSLRDITRRAANISRNNSSNARSQGLVVRGIGRRGSTEAQDPTVGITVDGIPYLYPGLSAWDWVDIDNVEVARGPQGTTGGGYASFGNLTLNTKRPTFDPTTEWSLRLGQRDTLFGTAAIGGPIVEDKLAWRGTFYVNKLLGYYKNEYWNGNQTYTDRLKISGKTQFLFKPTNNYSVHVSVDLQPKTFQNDNGLNFFHQTPATYSDGKPVNMNNDPKTRLERRWFGQLESYNYEDNYLNYNSGTQNNDNQLPLITGTRGAGLTQNYTFGDDSLLTSITGWRDLDFEARNDEGTPFDISTQGGGGVRFQQFTQELRLNTRLADVAELTTGAFYAHHTYEVDSKTGWGDDAGAWFANAMQYRELDVDGEGRYLLQQSLTGLRRISTAYIDNDSTAVFGNVKFDITEQLKLTTGLRVSWEDRKNKTFQLIDDNGYGGLLNRSISSFGVPLGGFDLYRNATNETVWVRDGRVVNETTPGAVAVAGQSYGLTTDTRSGERLVRANAAADAAAQKYFGAANFAALTNAQKQQLLHAQTLRQAQLGQIFNMLQAEVYKKTQYTYVVSPSYKFNDQVTGYFSFQHGEKPGISQVIGGNSILVDGESGNHFELGTKTSLFDNSLLFNADIFLSRLKNYQQTTRLVDDFTTTLNNDGQLAFLDAAANVPRIQIHGLEIDGSYNGIPFTTITLSAAYNIAKYKKFETAPLNPETNPDRTAPGYSDYQDFSGRILPGAAKYTGNLGVDFRYPLWSKYEVFANANANYTSRYNSDISLSRYSWINDYTVFDAGLGFGRRDQGFSVTLLGRNIADAEGKAYNWQNGILDTTPRWYGVIFAGRL
jgi:iron complex outermembrane receptor protein